MELNSLDLLLSILKRTLILGTPLLLGTLGEIITERSGILNLGVEGMISLGAVVGFVTTFISGNPWLGMFLAIIAGVLFSLIHAYASVTLQANQVVSGLALTMLGLGFSSLIGKPFIGKPLAVKMQPLKIPFLGDIPILGDLLFNQDIYFYLSILLWVASWVFLYKTSLGITIRSVGENPKAAETQGISIGWIRYLCVMIGGGFAGMAGAHLSTAYSRSWMEGVAGGRGWIVIALTIFSLWNPLRALFGAFLFGGIFVLQYLLQRFGISPNLLAMLPYVSTLVVLLVYGVNKNAQRKMNAPATLGEPFKKGGR